MNFLKNLTIKNDYFYNISFCLLFGIFLIFMLSSIGFIFRISINPFYTYLSFLISTVVLFFLNKKDNLKFLIPFVLVVLMILISVDISTFFYDFSWDGCRYHQSGIFFLKEGWNPIYENIEDFYNNKIDKTFFLYPNKTNAFWLEHYSKFSEILAANIYSITNRIESGKVINILFSITSFLACFYAFGKFGKPKYYNFIISFLLIANPVCIYQQYTYMNDNLLYYSFLIFLCGIIISEKEEKFSVKTFFFIIFSATILVNIKIGGVYLFLVSSLVYFLYLMYLKKIANMKIFLRIFLIIIFFAVLSGINPYLTNVAQNKHFLYPFCGEDKINVLSNIIPSCFKNKSSLEKLYYSTFSKTGFKKDNYCLKIPFTYSDETAFSNASMTFSGFGYFWSGILLISLVFCILKQFNFEKEEDKRIYFLVLSIILVSILLNSEAWFARYAPQFWIFPLWLFFFAFNKFKKNILLFLTILLVFYNCTIIEHHHLVSAWNYLNQVKNFQIYVRSIEEEMFVLKLKERNIPYNVNDLKFENVD